MTSEQHHRLTEISIGLFGTLDAMDTLCNDRDATDALQAAALALSLSLKTLVDEIEPPRLEAKNV